MYRNGSAREEIAAHIVLDGAGHESAVTHALGSQRYLVTITGPGGHSWTDAGRPNPIVLLSRAIERFSLVVLPEIPRTTMNVGTIEGGTAINAIPERASARIDLRSTDPEQLIRLEVELHRAVEDAVLAANHGRTDHGRTDQGKTESGVRFAIDKIGTARSCGSASCYSDGDAAGFYGCEYSTFAGDSCCEYWRGRRGRRHPHLWGVV
jgi:tripeptide aminopeptidase